MKHRGRICDRCGVEVISSSVRRTRFGHIELDRALVDPLRGRSVTVWPVLPPALREERDSELEARYHALVTAPSSEALEALCDALLSRLYETLIDDRVERVGYSAGAVALVNDDVDPRWLGVPFVALKAAAMPMLQAKAVELGCATTLAGARVFLDQRLDEAIAILEWTLASRPLLLHRADATASIVAATALAVLESPVFLIGRELAERLDLRSGQRLVALIPLSADAAREARWLENAERDEALRVGEVDVVERSWVAQLAACPPAERRATFVRCVQEKAADPCKHWMSASLLGGFVCPDRAGLDDVEVAPFVKPEVTDLASTAANDLLDRSVVELELSIRAVTMLDELGITTIRDLVHQTENALMRSKKCTRLVLLEIRGLLGELGLSLGMRS
jgi:hypothetical protein